MKTTLSPLARLGVVAAIALVAAAAPSANATLLTYFNFNDSLVANGQDANAAALASDAPGVQATVITSNFASTDIDVAAGTLTNRATGDATAAGQSLSFVGGTGATGVTGTTGTGGNNGKYFQFSVSTLGFNDISLSYASRSTSTGFLTETVTYSTDNGATFNTFTGNTFTSARDSSFQLATFNFASVPALDNQTNVIFRITLAGATSSSGTTNFDNIQVNGVTAVPEPATVISGLLGLGGLCFHQRRRLIKAISRG